MSDNTSDKVQATSVPSCESSIVKTRWTCRATQTTPRWDRLKPGMYVSFDAEFQNYLKDISIRTPWDIKTNPKGKWRHRLGRVSVINELNEVILYTYVNYPDVKGIRKKVPGEEFQVVEQDLELENGAQPGIMVEAWLATMFENRTVVLHGGEQDRKSFYILRDVLSDSNKRNTRILDTQEMYHWLIPGIKKPGLAKTVKALLKEDIQKEGHGSVEDAQYTMKLFLAHDYGMA